MSKQKIFPVVSVSFLIATIAIATDRLALERDKFDLDWAHSNIGFSIDFMGLTKVEGRFTNYSGTILYDENDLTKSSVTVVIKTSSINTANDFRDRHLKTPDFFDAEKYPIIFFRSQRVEKRGDGFVLVGTLTMHGVSREIAIPFTQAHGRMKDMWENTRIGFLGKLKLDRRDFRIVGPQQWEHVLDVGRLTIGNEVEITLNLQGRIWNSEKIGGGEKSIATVLWKTVSDNGIDAALTQYRELKAIRPQDHDFGESELNALGHRLLQSNQIKEAIEVFKANAEAFPKSANVYDSLADAYAIAGKRELAVQNYEKSLGLNPNNTNAIEVLRYLESH